MRNSFVVFLMVLVASCANRVTPTGGEKDVKPPQLLQATPENKSVNFNAREIRLYFDEYVQLVDLQGQLLVSPLTIKSPEVKVNKKSMVITLPDSLLPNTTYTLSFGKAIADVHESNPIPDFQYVFSTGEYIDSLVMEGEVKDAAALSGVKGATVLIYRKGEKTTPDSVVFKQRPDYFARSNEKGEFKISNLPPGEYSIFAVDDKNNNYKCDNPAEEGLAFQEERISLPGMKYPLLRIAVLEPEIIRLVKPSKMDRHSALLTFNKPLDSLRILDLNGKKWEGKYYQTSYRDSLFLFQPDKEKDSLALLVFNGLQLVDTVQLSLAPVKGTKDVTDRMRIYLRQSPAAGGPSVTLLFNTNHPLHSLSGSAEVTEDSAKSILVPFTVTDTLRGDFGIKYPWQSGKRYKVILYPGELTDMYGYSNDTTRVEFTVPGNENTAMLSVKTNGLEAGKKYLLQLLNDKMELQREAIAISDSLFVFSYLTPGAVRLRLIEDVNNDGRWTYGNYGKRRQPEPVWMYPEALTLRSNWELEVVFKVFIE